LSDRLSVYLHDHLAGSNLAIELLETLEREYQGYETGAIASALLLEVRQDRVTLQRIVENVGSSSLDLKEAVAWLSEKALRAKLRHNDPTGIGTFEAFEALLLGVSGKLALWQALSRISLIDARVAGYDYGELATRAKEQIARIEDYRLRLASTALARAELCFAP
jgi:hypothetical protein